MTYSVNPYLGFAGNAATAMEFYKSAFGGELHMMTFADAGNADFVGEGNADKIMHAELRTAAGWTLMASDSEETAGSGVPATKVAIAAVAGDDAFDELDGIFTKLAEGGEVVVPLSKQSWGAAYGQVADTFGVTWHINIGG